MVTLPVWLGPGSLLEVSTLLVLGHRGVFDRGADRMGRAGESGADGFAAVGAVAGAVGLIDWHWDLSLALLLAGAAPGLIVAFVVGMPTLRLDGVFVAVTTLAFGLAVSGYFLDRAEFSWIPAGKLPRRGSSAWPSCRRARCSGTCLGRGHAGGAGHAGVAPQPVRPGAAGAQHQRDGPSPATGWRRRGPSWPPSPSPASSPGWPGACWWWSTSSTSSRLSPPPRAWPCSPPPPWGASARSSEPWSGAALVEGSAVFLPPSWQLFPSAFGVVIVLLAFPGGLASLVFSGRDKLLAVVGRRHGIDPAGQGARGGRGR